MSKSQLLAIRQSQTDLFRASQYPPTPAVNSSIQAESGCEGNGTCNSDQLCSRQDTQDNESFGQLLEQVSKQIRIKTILSASREIQNYLQQVVLNQRKQYEAPLFGKLKELGKLSLDDKNLLSKLFNQSSKKIQQDKESIQSLLKNLQYHDSISNFSVQRLRIGVKQQESINNPDNQNLVEGINKYAKSLQARTRNTLNQANPNTMNRIQYQNFTIAQEKIKQVGYKSATEYNQFKDFVDSFQSQSYCFLYPRMGKVKSFIEMKINQWFLFEVSYKELFKKYLDIFKAKIQFMSQWRLVYGSLQPLNMKLERVLEHRGSKHRAKAEPTMADLLFQHFTQQLQSRNARSNIYYVRNPKNDQKIPLSDFIAVTSEFFVTKQWFDVFGIVSQKIIRKNPSKQEIQSIQNKYTLSNNPSPDVAIDKEHICCSKFFYSKENILQAHIKSRLVLAGDIQQFSKSLPTVQKQVCGLLNSIGGVILFDCQAISTNVVPRGNQMIVKDMKRFEQQIKQCLERIYPVPEINKNIFLSFVPVAEPQNGKPKFIQGTYVARITVKPDRGSITYMLMKDDEDAQIYYRKQSLTEGGLQLFTGKKIHKFLRKKFNQYRQQWSDISYFEQQLLVPTVCNLDHRCESPEIGFLLQEKLSKKRQTLDQLRNKYCNVSVVAAKQQYHETILRNLAKRGIQCEIALPFRESKLRGAAQSAVLYHNCTFDQLLTIVSYNKEFEFGGRYLLLILITPFLKLTDRSKKNAMTEEDFRGITTWLKSQFPDEQMSIWEFINEKRQTEYYIKTKTREATLYVYIVLTQYTERSAFKSPKDIDKLSKVQLDRRLVQMFPKNNNQGAFSQVLK